MTDNVVDAAGRFSNTSKPPRPRAVDLEILKSSKKVPSEDRLVLARNLGALAAEINPERPGYVARQWFDRAWDGNGWEKRRRLVCFPGEALPDPRDEGAFKANSHDWATLIKSAAETRYPGTSDTEESERIRLHRRILRGTSFLPAVQFEAATDTNAQTLLLSLGQNIIKKIDGCSDLVHLWKVLSITPFKPTSYKDEPVDYWGYEGDSYSTGLLGEVSKRAQDIQKYKLFQESNWRFEPIISSIWNEDSERFWSYPKLRLGVMGKEHVGKIFAIPHQFWRDLPDDSATEEYAANDRVMEWLNYKGLLEGNSYSEQLPATSYTQEQGYGWQQFTFESVREVWLGVQPREDGSLGLWISAWQREYPPLLPVKRGIDCLAVEAHRASYAERDPLTFTPQDVAGPSADYACSYEFLEWPFYDNRFMSNGAYPEKAVSGLLQYDRAAEGEIGGWLDDLDNTELQDFLFRIPGGTRFCPSIKIDAELPPPCRRGTVAAALFENLSTASQQRVNTILTDQASQISEAGLAFYGALIAAHQKLVDEI